MCHASFERAVLENQKVISINKQTYIYVNYTLIYFFYSTYSIIQRIVIRVISVKFYRMTRKRMRDGKNEESAAKSRGQKRRVRTAARAALAEVVEPATQLHARTNTTVFLTHTSRRCMHCAVHADARTIPLLFSPFAIHFVPPPFSPSLSFALLHPIHPSFSRPSSFLYPTLVSLIPSFSTFSPSSSLHFLSLAVPHLPSFLLLLRLSVLSSRSFSPFSMPPSSTNTMLLSLSHESTGLRSIRWLRLYRDTGFSLYHSLFHSHYCSAAPLRVHAAAPAYACTYRHRRALSSTFVVVFAFDAQKSAELRGFARSR